MANFREIKYPIVIQFKTNEDDDWTSDMSGYITSFNINEKVEDEPFLFVENEIRIDFWDYDNKFIRSSWSSDINELEIRFISNSEVVFQGWVRLPEYSKKQYAISMNKNTKEGSLYFSSGIERYNNTIHFTTTINADKKRNDVLYNDTSNWNPYELTTPRGEKILGEKARLDELINFFTGDIEVDIDALDIYNSNDKCYIYIDREYFQNKETSESKLKTVLGFLKEVAMLYDCYIVYDNINNTMTFTEREDYPDTEDTIADFNGVNIIKLERKSNIPQYTGVVISHDNPPNEKSALTNVKMIYDAEYTKYNRKGYFQYAFKKDTVKMGGEVFDKKYKKYTYNFSTEELVSTTIDGTPSFITQGKHTYLIGEQGNTLDLNISLLGYLAVVNSGDYEPDSSITFNREFIVNFIRNKLIRDLVGKFLKYLYPKSEYTIELETNAPTIGERYSINDLGIIYGHIVEVDYERTPPYHTLITKWRRIDKYTIQNVFY